MPTVTEYRKYIYLEDLCPLLLRTFTDLHGVQTLAKKHPDKNIRNFFQAYLEECHPESNKPSCRPRKPKRRTKNRKSR